MKLNHHMITLDENEPLFNQPVEKAIIALVLAHRAVSRLRRLCRNHECTRNRLCLERHPVAQTMEPLCRFCEVLELTDYLLFEIDQDVGPGNENNLQGMARRLCALATVCPPLSLAGSLERRLDRLIAGLHGENAPAPDAVAEANPAKEAQP